MSHETKESREYKEKTRATYNGIAEQYIERDKAVIPETLEVREALDMFVKLLPTGSSVLDVGSGGGRDSRYLFTHGLRVKGIDFSQEMIHRAQELEPGIEYQIMDFEHLDFPQETFEGVWANGSLHHIPKKNLVGVLKAIYGILKNEGVFFIKVKQGEQEGFAREEKFGVVVERYFAFYKPEEITSLLQSIGFTVLEQHTTTQKEWIDVLSKK